MATGKKQLDDDEYDVVDIDDAIKTVKRKVMQEMEPITGEVKKLGEDVKGCAKQSDLAALAEQTKNAMKEMFDAIEFLENSPAPVVNLEQLKAELRAELTPLIKLETQATFREVLQRFGVKPSTLDSGDMNAIIGELIPLLMPAVMGAGGGLGALAGKMQQQHETEDIPAKRELSDAEKKEFQTKCQTCGAPLRVSSPSNECKKCGGINYAYRCHACREVFLTILAADEIEGTSCPLCNTSIKAPKPRR
jgi:predicted RNA-binding Zn-ribbon protein involved in translation (DUF1610 family)